MTKKTTSAPKKSRLKHDDKAAPVAGDGRHQRQTDKDKEEHDHAVKDALHQDGCQAGADG